MLKALIKKQFLECFRSYFINTKTGKGRSKSGVVLLFVFFIILMFFLSSVFYGVALMIGDILLSEKYTWLYFALMGMISIGVGTFGSVFNTYSSLYLSKDNELLLSMPIPSSKILISRIVVVYGMSMLYSCIVWIPALVYSWIFGNLSAIAGFFGILLLFLLALFVTVLTCMLGWLVAWTSKKAKNRSFLAVFLSLVFFFAYYYVSSNMMNYLQNLVMHTEEVGKGLKTWMNLIYQLGNAANGDVSAMLIFSGVTISLFALCVHVLSTSFTGIVTFSGAEKKVVRKNTTAKEFSVKSALLNREMKRFLSSPTYMLNCGFGIIMLPILSVAALFKMNQVRELILSVVAVIPEYQELLPLSIVFGICMILSINAVSTPSVSLEGKNLWILRSLPVSGEQVLNAKLNLHVLLNILPAVIAAFALGICIHADMYIILAIEAFVVAFVWYSGSVGLMIGLLHPNFHWTTEAMPIKQSTNVLMSMVAGWFTAAAVCGLYIPLRTKLSVSTYLCVSTAFLCICTSVLFKWMKTKGSKLFDAL